ncbi:diacylglycerol kinase catalytic domain-containing protein [Marinigracilibium pacificum]|uniref:Sugar kinase n=1 Tax=Marinigracilibium pacificum TaxID=2729599 RepID=A0A848J5V4_9BACT|nr:NAD(+)/NADH kinase [Marinigracilibium pacificum]NMM49900.1 sugar kinase [Marinigracilibium pacificum]
MEFERIVVVSDKTRLDALVERFNSKAQAMFYIIHNGGDFSDFEEEHKTYYECLSQIQKSATKMLKTMVLSKRYIPSFIFNASDIIVVVGRDGLVANVAKYVGTCPIIAVNPDTDRYSGVLLSFDNNTFQSALTMMLKNEKKINKVTLAKALLNDGQELLAFNDFFIGKKDHTSAGYVINYCGKSEFQSSSGLIISTGAGSSGWLSSVFNELNGLNKLFGGNQSELSYQMNWDDDDLCFVVREPYKSPKSPANIVAGIVNKENQLLIESAMPENGVIFSDGMLDDYISFNAGSTIEVSTSVIKAHLVAE